MRFAHLADCHIGSWRDPRLKDISTKAFVKAVDLCIKKNVDFVLIAGDLFDTSLPSIDRLKETVEKLKELKDNDIPVYIISGSHDFSPSGRSMLEVMEKAGLFINVAKGEQKEDKISLNFTTDEKTGAKITGLFGKKGALEKVYYENLIKGDIEKEQGYKIFMFHSLLSEFKPDDLKEVDSQPLSLLPKNFNYYAGGHPHFIFQKYEKDYGNICYPGPLFPNNFAEIEKLERGGFYIVDVEENGKTSIKWEPIQIYNIYKIFIDAENKTPESVEEDIKEKIKGKEFNNTIITLRIEGILNSGKTSDINFKEIFDLFYSKSAYFVMKNTNKLKTKEFQEIKVENTSVEETESKLIREHLGQLKINNLSPEKEESIVKYLMDVLSKEKVEGETSADFEEKLIEEAKKIFETENLNL